MVMVSTAARVTAQIWRGQRWAARLEVQVASEAWWTRRGEVLLTAGGLLGRACIAVLEHIGVGWGHSEQLSPLHKSTCFRRRRSQISGGVRGDARPGASIHAVINPYRIFFLIRNVL